MSYGPPTPPYSAPQPHAAQSPLQAGQPVRQPNLGLGVIAGFGAGVVAAIVWGGFTGVTHYRFALISLAVGFFVGWAMVKAAGRPAKELGIAAAIITLLACTAGDIGTIYVEAMHQTGASLSELMKVRGPIGVLSDDLSTDKLGIVFFAIAAFFAFQYGATGGTGRQRRPIAGKRAFGGPRPPQAQPFYGTPPVQPQYGATPQQAPGFGAPVPPPAYDPSMPAQPAYDPSVQAQPGYDAPVPPQPQYGQPDPAPPAYFGDSTQPSDAGFFTQPPAGGQ